jgi:dienelactone hydrolase
MALAVMGSWVKPPGRGPFPAVLLLHGGITKLPTQRLRQLALGAWASRFLAAGYVVAVTTYRERDINPQSREPIEDAIASVEYLQRLAYVDARSIVVNGTSGGGDLALSVAAEADVVAVVAEEPASLMCTGLLTAAYPKKGSRFTNQDGADILADPERFYTPEAQAVTRRKIANIRCPILILEGDAANPLNDFNRQTIVADLRSARKAIDILSYAGEPHSFAFYSDRNRTPHPSVALKAFDDVNAFLRRHVRTRPSPLNSALVSVVPF